MSQNVVKPKGFELVERPFSEDPMKIPAKQKQKNNVAPAKVDYEIDRLWESVGGLQKSRACLFNLIIYTKESCRTEYFTKLTQGITERFPCRLIFIHCREDGDKDLLNTDVSIISTGEVGNAITCDKIQIEAAPSKLEQVPFLILPLIVPDLPVYLMWGHDPDEDNAILPHLERFATRVLVDSECTGNLVTFAKGMRKRLENCKCEVMDFNWARLGGWRRLFSRVFETEEKVHTLSQAQEITIVYDSKQSSSIKQAQIGALFLQAWLASRLGWTFEKAEGQNGIFYKSEYGPVEVKIEGKEVEGPPPGSLLSIDIDSYDGVHFHMVRDGSSRHIRVNCTTKDRCELPAHYLLSHLNREQSLLREIFYETPGSHYEEMLATLEFLG